jgi:hypothetical protein
MKVMYFVRIILKAKLLNTYNYNNYKVQIYYFLVSSIIICTMGIFI